MFELIIFLSNLSHGILITFVIIYFWFLLLCYQIKAFLNQRLVELRNEETLSLQHQVHTVSPLVLQQYTPDAIETMMSGVSSAISLLTNRKTRDLIMILNSKRYCP